MIKENNILEKTLEIAEKGYGTYRWSYDMRSYLPVAGAMKMVQKKEYESIACGGFSAGCDMLLRAIAFTSVRCDLMILQGPWIPVLEEHAETVVSAIRERILRFGFSAVRRMMTVFRWRNNSMRLQNGENVM